jgi:glucose/arabinose dehydrogenase
MRHSLKKILLTTVIACTVSSTVFAALPANFEVETLASGMNLPTTIAFTPDGRVLIAEKGGVVRVYKNGTLLSTPLITLTDVNTYGDRGHSIACES